jgi:hypothetical protein
MKLKSLQLGIDHTRLIGAFIDGINERIGAEWRGRCIRLHSAHWREEWKQRARSQKLVARGADFL